MSIDSLTPIPTKRYDGLVRIRVVRQNKWTSVSLDDVLYRAVARLEGDDNDAASRWVRQAVAEVERLQEANDPTVAVDNAGLSRQVQRLAMRRIIDMVDFPPSADASA